MMFKWIPVALALAVTACSSTPEARYYQLPATANGPIVTGQALNRSVWIESVSVPDYLAGSGVVYQSSDVRYTIASNNLWASPLDQQLQQTLVSYLSRALPGAVVSSAPVGQQHDTVNVTVTGFHGRYDGRAVVSGQWVIQHDGQLQRRTFMLVLPQPEDGYDALVKTLATGWEQIATQIAQAVTIQDKS